jgi:hypothetical protein
LDVYEDIVMLYLSAKEGALIRPQVRILRQDPSGGPWEAYPDFLAINFLKPSIEVVEVSKAWDAPKDLASKLTRPHRENVEQGVRELIPGARLDAPIFWRFFVRRERCGALRSRQEYRTFVQERGEEAAEVTPLEDVIDWLRTLP